jgi:hypothetical protein
MRFVQDLRNLPSGDSDAIILHIKMMELPRLPQGVAGYGPASGRLRDQNGTKPLCGRKYLRQIWTLGLWRRPNLCRIAILGHHAHRLTVINLCVNLCPHKSL